jgi:hypothetical protein
MWFEGVASSTALDRQQERMTENAIRKMAGFVGVDLLPSHRAGPLDELGTVTETWADNRVFRVAGVLDASSSEARRLFAKVEAGRRYGLSVGGRVLKAFWAEDAELGKRIKHIDDVVLDHVALCRPSEAANPDTYLAVMAKSAELPEADPRLVPSLPGVVQRIARAVAEAIWPMAKGSPDPGGARVPACGDEGQGWGKGTGEDAGATHSMAGATQVGEEAELARVLERQSHLTRAVASLAERLEAMERRRGQSSAIPGQERPDARRGRGRAAGAHAQPASIWKGVI